MSTSSANSLLEKSKTKHVASYMISLKTLTKNTTNNLLMPKDLTDLDIQLNFPVVNERKHKSGTAFSVGGTLETQMHMSLPFQNARFIVDCPEYNNLPEDKKGVFAEIRVITGVEQTEKVDEEGWSIQMCMNLLGRKVAHQLFDEEYKKKIYTALEMYKGNRKTLPAELKDIVKILDGYKIDEKTYIKIFKFNKYEPQDEDKKPAYFWTLKLWVNKDGSLTTPIDVTKVQDKKQVSTETIQDIERLKEISEQYRLTGNMWIRTMEWQIGKNPKPEYGLLYTFLQGNITTLRFRQEKMEELKKVTIMPDLFAEQDAEQIEEEEENKQNGEMDHLPDAQPEDGEEEWPTEWPEEGIVEPETTTKTTNPPKKKTRTRK